MEAFRPLEVTQNDMDSFLADHGGVMKCYYLAFLGDADVNQEFSQSEGWNLIYLSLQKQMEKKSAWSMDPARTEQERAFWRSQVPIAMMNLCNVTLFHKDRLTKEKISEVFALIHYMRFVHPIGKILVDADVTFKNKIAVALMTIKNYLREL